MTRLVPALVAALAASRALAEGPGSEPDDARARIEANAEHAGQQGAFRGPILEAAQRERDRWGMRSGTGGSRTALTATGNVFVNLGPTRADFEWNGGRYTEIDSGRARQIVPHPYQAGIVYLNTAEGGVWKSYDHGNGWEPLTDALGTLSGGALAIDPVASDVLYLGFGDPFDVAQPGIVTSRDGGATWSPAQILTATYGGTQNLVADRTTDIKVDPANSQNVLVATNRGIFRSGDAGQTYAQAKLGNGTDLFYAWSIAWAGKDTWVATAQREDPANVSGTITSSFSAGLPGGALALFRSTDGGRTWVDISSAVPAAKIGRATLASALSTTKDVANSRLFMIAGAASGASTYDAYRSEDGGVTWQSLRVNSSGRPTNPNPDQGDLDVMAGQAFYNQAILVDPVNPDVVFIGGQLASIRSMDGGLTWSVLSDWLPAVQHISAPYVHADFHAFGAGADGTLYAGSDGGFFYSANARSSASAGQVSFTSARNEGLVTHLLYNVACAPGTFPASMQGWLAGGMQDNGTRVRSSSTTTFNQALGGDGIGVAVSGSTTNGQPDLLLATAPSAAGGQIFASSDGGNSWTYFQNGLPKGDLPFLVRLVRDERAPSQKSFLTFTAPNTANSQPGVYNSVDGVVDTSLPDSGNWAAVSGNVYWQDANTTTTGFNAPGGGGVSLRAINVHRGSDHGGVWGAVSNKYAYFTNDGGLNWTASKQIAPPGGTGVVFLLTGIAFDMNDTTGKHFYVSSRTMTTVSTDASNKTVLTPLPRSFGHVFETKDGGTTWTVPGAQDGSSASALPFVPVETVAVDPSTNTLYAGTDLGLYRFDGSSWSRMGGGSLPFTTVTDICISPANNKITVGTYGRGFWQIGQDAASDPAGVRGNGDTNFDQRIDGFDLIDLADAFGSTENSSIFRYQADLVGTTNTIDGDDLTALLKKFGGAP